MAEWINRRALKAEVRETLQSAQVPPRAMAALYLVLLLAMNLVDSLTGTGLLATFVMILITLIGAVLEAGFVLYCMAVRQGERAEFLTLFDGFSFAGKVVLLTLLKAVLVYLWSMLFIIPGIIASYRYRFALCNLCENPDLSALEALNRILGDSTPEASQAKTLAERGRVKYLLGQVEEAVADIRQAKSLDENGLDGVHYAIVGMDAFQNEDYETSQQDFLKAARLSQQNNAEYYEQAILCAYMVGDYQAVRDMGEEAQGKNFMTSTAWLLDGIALFSLEDYEAAELALTRSMDTGITPTGVYYYRGLTRLALGEYALAAQDFGEAIQQGESVLECTFNRGICYYALGENEKAVLDFQTVEQDSPDPALAASAAEMLEAMEQASAQTTGE